MLSKWGTPTLRDLLLTEPNWHRIIDDALWGTRGHEVQPACALFPLEPKRPKPRLDLSISEGVMSSLTPWVYVFDVVTLTEIGYCTEGLRFSRPDPRSAWLAENLVRLRPHPERIPISSGPVRKLDWTNPHAMRLAFWNTTGPV